jgi:hypothetical protein
VAIKKETRSKSQEARLKKRTEDGRQETEEKIKHS